jgi:hypothetical protein
MSSGYAGLPVYPITLGHHIQQNLGLLENVGHGLRCKRGCCMILPAIELGGLLWLQILAFRCLSM